MTRKRTNGKLKKRSQFMERANRHKCFRQKGLWPSGPVPKARKQSQFKPKSRIFGRDGRNERGVPGRLPGTAKLPVESVPAVNGRECIEIGLEGSIWGIFRQEKGCIAGPVRIQYGYIRGFCPEGPR